MVSIRGYKLSQKRLQLRESAFPSAKGLVWQAEKGWRLVPRTMPLLMTLISMLAPKGKRDGAARVYLELWFRDFGEGFVELTDPDVHAFAAGYTSARGARSWRECVEVLAKLGFIKIAPKGSRSMGYVLLVHPDQVVAAQRAHGKLDAAWLNAYTQRTIEIGSYRPPVLDSGDAGTPAIEPPRKRTRSGARAALRVAG